MPRRSFRRIIRLNFCGVAALSDVNDDAVSLENLATANTILNRLGQSECLFDLRHVRCIPLFSNSSLHLAARIAPSRWMALPKLPHSPFEVEFAAFAGGAMGPGCRVQLHLALMRTYLFLGCPTARSIRWAQHRSLALLGG